MSSNECKIRKVTNGYILQYGTLGNEDVYRTLDEVLQELLRIFEGKASAFTGSSYGRVRIQRGKEDE